MYKRKIKKGFKLQNKEEELIVVGIFTVTTQTHKRLSSTSQRENHLKWGLRERVQSSDEPASSQNV